MNLGCGKSPLKEYVNVDINGPDVQSDLRTLPFPPDYADEIMAIHVIEHFYHWEVQDLLKHWIKILKPGGKLILECPDLAKLVGFFASGDTRDQMTMWGFYGDPSHKDPLMCHRWAYTPQSLSDELRMAGLTQITHEEARFHVKLRDMRVTGIK